MVADRPTTEGDVTDSSTSTTTESIASTTTPTSDPAAISVPLNPTTPVSVEMIATVEYGPGEEQIEVLNGEFPPPAVWHVGGVLVLEDEPLTGLTGDGVIVRTGPDAEFEDGRARRFQPVTIDIAEPGGTPIAVRSLDGGGIVVVTVHDEPPEVRIRRYDQNPPGVFAEFGTGADRDGPGDSELRITAEGATWGGDVVIPPSASNPAAVRPIVTSDPPFAPSSSYEIERPPQDGEPAIMWTLEVEIDEQSPPGSGQPLVEPFGNGALVVIRNSSAQFAEPVLIVLDSDGGWVVYDLDGWRVSDVRPEGALLTRSTSEGLELAVLRPTPVADP